MKPTKYFFAAALLGLALLAPNAYARDNDRDWNGHQNNNWHHGNDRHDHGHHNNWNRPNVVYKPVVLKPYAHQPYYYQPAYPMRTVRYITPPRYYVGQRIYSYQVVPATVIYRNHWRPAPYGYFYAAADDNVFLVRQSDSAIVQILSLLLN